VATQLDRSLLNKRNTGWQILVVDDEKPCADLFATILRKDGYTVRASCSGPDALEKLREQPADLVLADMVMPGMNGMQLLANIKELYPDTDVIILTGYGTIEDSLEAMRRGASDFLPKPFQPRELGRLTAACLRAKSASSDEAFLKQSNSMIELARLMTQTTDMHSLPSRAVELACENFDADSAILFVYEPAQDKLSVVAQTGMAATRWKASEQLDRQGLEAVRQRSIVLSAEPNSGDCHAYIPLLVNGRPRGVLCMRRKGGPWFHEKSSELLEIFATHLALAIESARLYETASEQVRDLEDLIVRSRTVSLKLHPDEIADQLLVETSRLTRAEVSAVMFTAQGLPRFRARPELAEGGPLFEAIREKMRAAFRDPALSAEVRSLSGFPREIRSRLRSFVSAPLAAHGKDVGLVGLFSSEENCFTAEDMRRLSALADNAGVAIQNASMLERLSSMYAESIELLSASVESVNAFSLGHSRQVSVFAGELARALKLTEPEVFRVEDGALLHDIGKICIPDSILKKPSPLSAEEYAIVKAHPVYGANMFDRAPHLSDLVPIVRHHHEHWDGRGYPDGLRGEDIPLAARLVALGDVFDALISHRPYRPAIRVEHARRMIELKAGSQFDPHLSGVFLSLPLEDMIER